MYLKIRWFSALLLATVFIQQGCGNKTNYDEMKPYIEPAIPEDIPRRYYPEPNQKAYEELPPGKKYIDLHNYYKVFYKLGWEDAVFDLKHNTVKNEDEVAQNISAIKVGRDAFGDGYKAALSSYNSSKE